MKVDILQNTFWNLSHNLTFPFSSTSEWHSMKESNQPVVSIPKRGKRNCAVINCNTGEHRGLWKSWYSKRCLLHNVYNGTKLCNCQPPIALFTFPSKQKYPEDNLRWQRLVSRKGWVPNIDSRICSRHFVDKKPSKEHPYPTENLGHNNIPLFARRCNRKTHSVKRKLLQADGNRKLNVKTKLPTQFESIAEHSYSIQSNANCKNCGKLIAKIEQLEEQLGKYKDLLLQLVKRPFTVNNFASDKKINTYIGIKDLFTFEFLFSKLHQQAKLMRHWPGPSKYVVNKMQISQKGKKPGVKLSLSLKDEFYITLMRICTGSSCELIGNMFGVSKSCVSRICTSWFKFLATELSPLIYSPSQGVTKLSLPVQFKSNLFKDVRHIIDCTEFFIETPTGLKMKQQFWSPYKNHYTTKLLVSISPNGHFNYISKLWSGWASDGYIVRNSGFLDEIKKGRCSIGWQRIPHSWRCCFTEWNFDYTSWPTWCKKDVWSRCICNWDHS